MPRIALGDYYPRFYWEMDLNVKALWGILDFKVAPEKKPHRPSQIFQLIFAQTYKISCQDVFFLSSRPVPSV